jgi:pimeloyl-ACP methyl ester carboxylesterase/RimJ/RimL family protein N-acetyltransferase
MDILETERLRLRTVTADDAAFYLELVNDPAFIEHIGDRGIRTLDDARRSVLDGPAAMQEERGHSLYVVELRDKRVPVGMCGLIKRATLDDIDIGYAFLPQYCGQGFAYEAARAVLDYAASIGINRVAAITSPNNVASNQLLRKLGLRFQHFVHLTPEDPGTNLYLVELPVGRAMPGTTDCWVNTGQGRLLARRWQRAGRDGAGDQPPILLFHDSLGCVEMWRTFPAVLAQSTGREVIAYDRLGFGQSGQRTDPPGIDFVRDEALRALPALREQLGIDRFVAFGHSVGGGMAVHCAAMYPSACVALITESAQAFVEDKTREGIREARQMFRQAEAFERLRRYHGDKARWVLDAWTETWLSPQFSNWSLDEVLPQVTCPTLAIHGSDDEYGSTQHPETIARLVGGPSQLKIMPGVRHVPHREQEQWVADRVARFLLEGSL